MALIDVVTLSEFPPFKNRVKAAMIAAALNVVGEAVTIGKEILATKRHGLGVEILNTPDGKLQSFCLAVASNGTIQAGGINAPDGDIEYVVSSVFNDIAGVKTSEL